MCGVKWVLPKSHPHRPGQREAEGLADGAAAGVEDVLELVAVEKGG